MSLKCVSDGLINLLLISQQLFTWTSDDENYYVTTFPELVISGIPGFPVIRQVSSFCCRFR